MEPVLMQSPNANGRLVPTDPAIQAGLRFLQALFAETDRILFRPIETWTESGKKKSRVDYRNTCHLLAYRSNLISILLNHFKLAAEQKLNLFFGVCPRYGGRSEYDLAWQIRTVRALWADIDHVSVTQAREHVERAKLPVPSILVNSGNGVHLYWLLDAPYLIDDVGDPLPVKIEWTRAADDSKRPRKYVEDNGETIYLDEHRQYGQLSPKAKHIQEILAGIAQTIGGDHTTDLARLLRIPGSLNRKDQRTGRTPLPTELVECDPTRVHSLAVFESFKAASPEVQRAKQIATMPLPKTRKISTSNSDRLAQLIAASSIAPVGARSEADFAICCFAVRIGADREVVWGQVEQVGKFAEDGRRYFDLTWENAELEVRSDTYEKVQKSTAAKNSPKTLARATEKPTIHVDPSNMPVGDTLSCVTNHLLRAGNCFIRAEQVVVINDNGIRAVLSPPELAGLLNQHVEFYFVDDEGGEFKPFPPSYGNTWLNHYVERNRLPVIKLFTHNPVYTEDWRVVVPGFDAESGIYYAGTAVESRDGTQHLDTLLQDFCFRKPADRSNYLGMLLTAILVPRFIGSKPAVLFNGNQPELGKSILAQIISIVRDGQPCETATYNPNDEEFEKRLGSIVRRGGTTIIIDNAKSQGRTPRIESACLERSITDPILSFRLLGQSASIRAENSHIFCITANTPDISRDLVTRSTVVNLFYEGDPEHRTFSIADPEGYAEQHRLELLGELVGMVERWKAAGMPMAQVHSRFNKRGWGNIVGGILQICGQPDFLANAEEAAAALDDTRRDFTELILILADHPQGIWTASELVDLSNRHGLLKTALGEGSARSLATKMGTLAGRFLDEQFPLGNDRTAVFRRSDDRKGKVYQVFVNEVPNLDVFAEPLPNLEIP